MRYKVGTNQFKKRIRFFDNPFANLVIYGFFVMTLLLGAQSKNIDKTYRQIFIHPKSVYADMIQPTVIPSPTPNPTPTMTQKEIIEEEVKQVFGEYYPKAKKLLDCENFARNPNAMNDNTTWGGKGRDWGVFQINDSWQGVTNKVFLTDYHINIRMAWNIFINHGYKFSAWTCGRSLHI